jgi:hypothetical protein
MSLEEAVEIVDRYQYLIFKRIRLHLINEFAERNRALARRVLMDRDLFDDYEYKHEYAMLVGRRLSLLIPEERETWFGGSIPARIWRISTNPCSRDWGVKQPTRNDKTGSNTGSSRSYTVYASIWIGNDESFTRICLPGMASRSWRI